MLRAHVALLLFPSTQADRAGGKVSHKCHFSAFSSRYAVRASVTAGAFWCLTVAATIVVVERLPWQGSFLEPLFSVKNSELVLVRPAESSTSCLCYSQQLEQTASLVIRCAATSLNKKLKAKFNFGRQWESRCGEPFWNHRFQRK